MVHSTTGKKEANLLDYWRILLKRKWVIVSVTAVLLAASGVVTFTATPLYQASATLLIDDPGSSMLTIQDLLKIDSNAKAIVSSGYSSDPVMAKFADYGFCDVLVKPYRMEDVAAVHGVVDLRAVGLLEVDGHVEAVGMDRWRAGRQGRNRRRAL